MRPIGLLKKVHQMFISGIQWTFVCVMYACFSFVSYYCLFVIGSYYHQLHGKTYIDVLICLPTLWLLFNVIFNYIMMTMTSPGIAKEKEKGFEKVLKHCKICEQPKPIRTHHCKICDKCVLQMDHHLPLAHNCIGHQNRRYLVNALTYSELTILVMLLLNERICNDLKFQYLLSVQILMTTLSLVVGVYAILEWYLVISGKTLVEFMRRQKILINSSIENNIKIVFGTSSLLRALAPSVRPLEHDGISWPQIPERKDSLQTSSVTLQI